ncbi:unnamed protein product [Fraxinus pennsylvanica]|uniref:Pentatricopeptide repeat-containing protein n=1 Tax=Fraxinus pennsylvanica TaxID=56036 RepID=A0AAD2DPS1_9LAMI|nr:unnamed protein product [Fraxinus pennsylvanica]
MLTMKSVSLVRNPILSYYNHHQNLGWWVLRSWFNSWSHAIRNASSSSPLKALKLYSQMHRKSLPFDSFSILYAINSCTHFPENVDSLSIIRHLHAHLLKLGFNTHVYVATSLLHSYALAVFCDACNLFEEMPERNSVTWNTMITGYSRHGDVKSACKIFNQMPKRDLASWTAMITAYMNSGFWDEGLALFRQILTVKIIDNEYLKPDQLILGSVLAGCANMGSVGLVFGKSLHGFAVKNDWQLNFEMAEKVIDQVKRMVRPENDGGVYTLIADLYVLSDKWIEAERLRKLMLNKNVRKARGSSFIRNGDV